MIMVSLTVTPLKVAANRPRPREVIKAHSEQEEQFHSSHHLSFPSGDTAAVFAVATVLIPFVTWPSACLLMAACTGVALLRVTAMAHYPSDVLAGAAIGSLAGWFALQVDRQWLPFEQHRFNLSRGFAILGIAIIPLAFRLPEGIDKLVIFLGTYGFLAICIFMATRAGGHFEKFSAVRFANPNRFDRILRYLRKRRTLSLKIAFLIVIAENIVNARKPHELGFSDISIMALVGLILIVGGTSIRFWARGYFVKGSLFTTGPYGIVRHPLYLGSLLVVVGVLFQLNGWFNWALVLPVFAVFHAAAIIHEERSLGRRFDRQWHLYRVNTPALIPSLRPWIPRKTCKWNWKVYLSTGELSASLMFLSLPLLIELAEDYVFEGILGI